MQHDAHVVLGLVHKLLVVGLAQQREHGAVEAVGGLDDVGHEALGGEGVDVFELLAAVLLMAAEVEVGAVVGAVDLAPAEGEEELDVAGGLGVVRELLMVVVAQMLLRDAEGHKELLAELLEVVVELAVGAGLAEGLELHLLKLDRAEGEVARGDLVAEGLADLPDREGELGAHGAQNVRVIHVLALGVLRAQVDDGLGVVGDAAEGLEHEVEFADIGEIVLAAVGAGDGMGLDIIEHLLLGHAVGVRVGIEVVDQVVGAEAHLALLAVEQGIGEARHMAARLPHARIHEDVGVDLEAVVPLLDELLAPGVLDVVLEPGAERAVVPGVGKAAVDLGAGEDEAAVFAQGDDLVHGFFGVVHCIVPFPRLAAAESYFGLPPVFRIHNIAQSVPLCKKR